VNTLALTLLGETTTEQVAGQLGLQPLGAGGQRPVLFSVLPAPNGDIRKSHALIENSKRSATRLAGLPVVSAAEYAHIVTFHGTASHPAPAGAVLLVGLDVPTAHREEFEDWYNTEHLPSMCAVPGVHFASRYRLVTKPNEDRTSWGFLALFHVTSPDVISSASWEKHRTSPWTDRMRRIRSGGERLVLVPAAWAGKAR
jgi:hypothetical protein